MAVSNITRNVIPEVDFTEQEIEDSTTTQDLRNNESKFPVEKSTKWALSEDIEHDPRMTGGKLVDLTMMQREWIYDAIRKIEFYNLTQPNSKSKSDKAPKVGIKITLNIAHSQDMMVANVGGVRAVVRFRDFLTGLIVANVRKNGSNLQYNSVMQYFQQQVLFACWRQASILYNELKVKQKRNQKAYDEKYKPLMDIKTEIQDLLDDGIDIIKQVQSQIRLFGPAGDRELNQFCIFKDTDVIGQQVTVRLPYNNPLGQKLTEAQVQLVERFLGVFLNDENRNRFSWYMGAAVTNTPLYHSNISKMMVVSSAGGGCGKNTLVGAITKGLFGDDYRDVKPDFDSVFDKSNRFGTGELLNLRVTQYNEANFSTVDEDTHDFSGLSVSELKSFISDGYISRERKYQDTISDRVSALQIVLSNHFPDIGRDRTDLTRRILAVTVKASRMEAKGRKLGLNNESAVYRFVKKNIQAFANYFAVFYISHPRMYTNFDYDADQALGSVTESRNEQSQRDQEWTAKIKNLLAGSPLTGLKELGRFCAVDVSRLIDEIKAGNSDDIRIIEDGEDKGIYINSADRFFSNMGVPQLKTALLNMVPKKKKFHANMFVLGSESDDLFAEEQEEETATEPVAELADEVQAEIKAEEAAKKAKEESKSLAERNMEAAIKLGRITGVIKDDDDQKAEEKTEAEAKKSAQTEEKTEVEPEEETKEAVEEETQTEEPEAEATEVEDTEDDETWPPHVDVEDDDYDLTASVDYEDEDDGFSKAALRKFANSILHGSKNEQDDKQATQADDAEDNEGQDEGK